MRKNKFFLFFNIFLILLITGCTNKLDYESNSVKPSSYKIYSDSLDDKLLSTENFDVSIDSNKTIVYIQSLKSNKLTLYKYECTNNGVMNISIEENTNFVISLHANSIISYDWNIKNNIDNSVLKFEKKTKLKVPFQNHKQLIGVNNDRQNFYFKTLKKGNQNIILKYEHIGYSEPEYFQIKVNLNIN